MYKCTCKVVVLLIKPLVFLTFSLPSASLDLKVPINHNDDNNDNAKKKTIGFMSRAKQQLCTCITLFLVIHFFDV